MHMNVELPLTRLKVYTHKAKEINLVKPILKVVLPALLICISAPTFAEDYFWFVKKLEGVKSTDTDRVGEIFGVVKKDDFVEAPIQWAARICQYDKSIVAFRDNIKRHVISCSYAGHVRKTLK